MRRREMKMTEMEKGVFNAINLAIKYEDIYCVHVNGIVDYLGVVGNPHAADLTVNQVKGVVGSLVKKRKIYEVEPNHFDTFK
jgi:hypothetical protein